MKRRIIALSIICLVFSGSLCMSQYDRYWDAGVVQYYYEDGFSQDEIDQIELAMATWEDNCGVSFRETKPKGLYGCDRSQDYPLIIYKGRPNGGGHATLGSPEMPEMVLGEFSQRVILHELGHVLGFHHEHQRPDRDLYITVLWENMEPGVEDQFQAMGVYDPDFLDLPYDYDSVLHYKPLTYSVNGLPTIKAKDGRPDFGGAQISAGDACRCRRVYGDPF